MDRWLNNAAALVYVNRVWVVLNHKGGLISWTEDPKEAAWLSEWILGTEAEKQRKAQTAKKRAPDLRPRSGGDQPSKRSPSIVVPIRRA